MLFALVGGAEYEKIIISVMEINIIHISPKAETDDTFGVISLWLKSLRKYVVGITHNIKRMI